MKHFRHPGQAQESKWVKATYRVEKADNTVLPRPLLYLSALIRFYLIKRRSEYEKHEEIAGYYIQYCKACLLRYVYITSKHTRRKAREKKKLARDALGAALSVHQCRKCNTKKYLDSLKIVIDDGRIFYECKQCPSSTSSNRSRTRREQKERKKEQRKTTRQRGVDLSYYKQVLGISGDITKEKIDKAYREKVKQVHPDAGGSTEQFKQVKKARDKLNKYAVV